MLRYPGGKSRLKREILRYMYNFHDQNQTKQWLYIEPFAGALSVGLSVMEWDFVKEVFINDKDFGITCFWNSVISFPNELCALIEKFEPSVDKFFEFQDFLLKEPTGSTMSVVTEIGFKKLSIHQMSYSGLGTKAGGPIGGRTQSSNYDVGCRWNAKNLIKEIWATHNLFKSKKIRNPGCCTNWDFEDCLDHSIKSQDATFFYLDPPYYVKGNELYQHSFSQSDHERMRDLLRDDDRPWVLSYDDCPEIRAMYDWAAITEIQANYTINTSRNRRELVIVNPHFSKILLILDNPVDLLADAE